MTKKMGRPASPWPADLVADLSEAVYRVRLGKKDVTDMIAKDKDDGEKLRQRSRCYNIMTTLYLDALKKRGMLNEPAD